MKVSGLEVRKEGGAVGGRVEGRVRRAGPADGHGHAHRRSRGLT